MFINVVQELKRLLELPVWQVPALPPHQRTYTLSTIADYVDGVVGRVAASTIPPPPPDTTGAQPKGVCGQGWEAGKNF